MGALLNLDEISAEWLNVCGPHDYSVTGSIGCSCPEGDPRPVISRLVAGVERLTADLTDLRERFAALVVLEAYIGESGENAAHNIRRVLDGTYDPRTDADRWGLDYRQVGA